MLTNTKVGEDRCSVYLAEWHSLFIQQVIMKYVLSELVSQMGLQKWKTYLISTEAMRMYLADFQLQVGSEMHIYSWANAVLPTGCSWPMADHSQDAKISPYLGNRGLIWWLTQRFPKDFSTFLRLYRSLIFPPHFPHLEVELRDHLIALLVLTNSLPIFSLINIPLIKSSRG